MTDYYIAKTGETVGTQNYIDVERLPDGISVNNVSRRAGGGVKRRWAASYNTPTAAWDTIRLYRLTNGVSGDVIKLRVYKGSIPDDLTINEDDAATERVLDENNFVSEATYTWASGSLASMSTDTDVKFAFPISMNRSTLGSSYTVVMLAYDSNGDLVPASEVRLVSRSDLSHYTSPRDMANEDGSGFGGPGNYYQTWHDTDSTGVAWDKYTGDFGLAFELQQSTSSPLGSDSNSGTSTSPWATLAKVMTVANARDNVYFYAGTYDAELSHNADNTYLLKMTSNHPALKRALTETGEVVFRPDGAVIGAGATADYRRHFVYYHGVDEVGSDPINIFEGVTFTSHPVEAGRRPNDLGTKSNAARYKRPIYFAGTTGTDITIKNCKFDYDFTDHDWYYNDDPVGSTYHDGTGLGHLGAQGVEFCIRILSHTGAFTMENNNVTVKDRNMFYASGARGSIKLINNKFSVLDQTPGESDYADNSTVLVFVEGVASGDGEDQKLDVEVIGNTWDWAIGGPDSITDPQALRLSSVQSAKVKNNTFLVTKHGASTGGSSDQEALPLYISSDGVEGSGREMTTCEIRSNTFYMDITRGSSIYVSAVRGSGVNPQITGNKFLSSSIFGEDAAVTKGQHIFINKAKAPFIKDNLFIGGHSGVHLYDCAGVPRVERNRFIDLDHSSTKTTSHNILSYAGVGLHILNNTFIHSASTGTTTAIRFNAYGTTFDASATYSAGKNIRYSPDYATTPALIYVTKAAGTAGHLPTDTAHYDATNQPATSANNIIKDNTFIVATPQTLTDSYTAINMGFMSGCPNYGAGYTDIGTTSVIEGNRYYGINYLAGADPDMMTTPSSATGSAVRTPAYYKANYEPTAIIEQEHTKALSKSVVRPFLTSLLSTLD